MTNRRPSNANPYRRQQTQVILLLLPFLVLLALFTYVPLFGWSYAFVKYVPGKSVFNSNFVGLKYFRLIFTDYGENFLLVLRNTFVLSGMNILSTVFPVLLAILITLLRNRHYSKICQTIVSSPDFISWVLVYSVIFLVIASDTSAYNTITLRLGLASSSTNILSLTKPAWIVQICIYLWKNMGYNSIIYLSAISSIDQELYEAADIDGANRFQKVVHVMIPGLSSTYVVMLMLAICNMLSNGFEQYWLFGNGMTLDKLEVFDTYVYRVGIVNGLYSLSTAFGIFKTLVSVLILTLANQGSKLLRGETIF